MGLISLLYSRDANHSDFCGIVPIFNANFRITISDVKIPANNDFKMVPDKIKESYSYLHTNMEKITTG